MGWVNKGNVKAYKKGGKVTKESVDKYEKHVAKQEDEYIKDYESKGLHDKGRKYWLAKKNRILKQKKAKLAGRGDPE